MEIGLDKAVMKKMEEEEKKKFGNEILEFFYESLIFFNRCISGLFIHRWPELHFFNMTRFGGLLE
jgi:hypothetical protein